MGDRHGNAENKRIMLQLPEGLKTKALEIAERIGKGGADVLICVEPCYGACDLRDAEAQRMGCEKLVHYGHSDFGLKTEVPVEYEEYRYDAHPGGIVEKNIGLLAGFKNIGLLATVQHVGSLDEIRKILEIGGKNVVLGRPSKAKYDGQVLGCDVSAATSVADRVDCFLLVATGRFHAQGLGDVRKPVFVVDAETGTMRLSEANGEKAERQRHARVAIARRAEVFGILLSTKPGQANVALATASKRVAKDAGKKAHILVADEFTPEKLLGIGVDCYVNCACPRMTDDAARYEKPIVNPGDVKDALDKKHIK